MNLILLREGVTILFQPQSSMLVIIVSPFPSHVMYKSISIDNAKKHHKYKFMATLMDPKPKKLVLQLQCTASGCAQQLIGKKKYIYIYIKLCVHTALY